MLLVGHEKLFAEYDGEPIKSPITVSQAQTVGKALTSNGMG